MIKGRYFFNNLTNKLNVNLVWLKRIDFHIFVDIYEIIDKVEVD
jgi:hypothetical protein